MLSTTYGDERPKFFTKRSFPFTDLDALVVKATEKAKATLETDAAKKDKGPVGYKEVAPVAASYTKANAAAGACPCCTHSFIVKSSGYAAAQSLNDATTKAHEKAMGEWEKKKAKNEKTSKPRLTCLLPLIVQCGCSSIQCHQQPDSNCAICNEIRLSGKTPPVTYDLVTGRKCCGEKICACQCSSQWALHKAQETALFCRVRVNQMLVSAKKVYIRRDGRLNNPSLPNVVLSVGAGRESSRYNQPNSGHNPLVRVIY